MKFMSVQVRWTDLPDWLLDLPSYQAYQEEDGTVVTFSLSGYRIPPGAEDLTVRQVMEYNLAKGGTWVTLHLRYGPRYDLVSNGEHLASFDDPRSIIIFSGALVVDRLKKTTKVVEYYGERRVVEDACQVFEAIKDLEEK